MTDKRSFEKIIMLLESFDCVSNAAAYHLEDDSVQIRFRTESFASLKRICDCVSACNESIQVKPPWAYFSDETERSERMCFTVTIEEDWTEESPPSTSQMIGVYLARDLKHGGQIDQETADRIQEEWNAVPH